MRRPGRGKEGDESELHLPDGQAWGQLMKLRASGEPGVMMELDDRVKTDARRSL
jgi:hypothetical protein